MLKFYCHPKAGYCAKRRKGDSVPAVILQKLVSYPERFLNRGLVPLIEVCVRCINKLEEDPLKLLIQVVN